MWPETWSGMSRQTLHFDVLQECQIDGYWNVNGDRILSGRCTSFTQFNLVNTSPPRGYTWSGRRLTNIQWSGMSKKSQRQEKQPRAEEKPKLDKARKLRGTHHVDPDDKEFNEALENARERLQGIHP